MRERPNEGTSAGRRSSTDLQNEFDDVLGDDEVGVGEVVDTLAEVITGLIGDFCVVCVVAPGQRALQVAAVDHVEPDEAAQLSRRVRDESWRIGEGLEGRVVETGKSFFAPEWPGHEEAAKLDGSYVAADGDWRVGSLMIVPMRVGRDVVGQVVVGRHRNGASYEETDLTLGASLACQAASKIEQIDLNDRLRQTNGRLQDALRLRDRFIEVASRRLQSPLSVMRQVVEQMIQKADDDGAALAADLVSSEASTLGEQVDRMASTVDQLLDISRLTDGRVTDLVLEEVDLVDRVQAVVDSVAGRDVETRVEASGADARGVWDPGRIDQMTRNLVEILKKVDVDEAIEIQTHGDEEFVRLTVGRGAPDSEDVELETALEDFVRRASEDDEADGLGLWVVRELVGAFGGTIGVEGTPETGMYFQIRLPRDVSPYARTEGGERVEPPDEVDDRLIRERRESPDSGSGPPRRAGSP